MGRKPHVLIIPFPAQGHVTPLMKFAHRISYHGIKVTFVNSDFIHAKLLAALPPEAKARSGVWLASIPDGLDPEDDRRDILKLVESFQIVMPDHLKDLIEKVNSLNDEDEKIASVIADITLGWWAIEVAEKTGIQAVPFCPFGPENLALGLHIPELIEAGVLNSTDGSPLGDELICVPNGIPMLSTNKLPWRVPSYLKLQEYMFQFFLSFIRYTDISGGLLCNCVYELDSSVCELIPNILPIGPLLESNHLQGHHSGKLWPEDLTCISWLDEQPAGSVIYVAFGSLAFLTHSQFNELALGLELVGRPFLWVVRSDGSAAEYPDDLIERVSNHQGKIVSWAPQEDVLAHPSVACFLSHCGWNSTMDGIAMGVPFLCWPCFGDQLLNQNCICNKWKVGLELTPDENGFVSRHEIKMKIETLVSDDGIKENAEKLKEIARKSVSEGGSSYDNFNSFIEAIKH